MNMKKSVTLIGVCFVFSGLQAQIKMSPNGNVGIQSSVTAQSALLVGGDQNVNGSGGWKGVFQSNDHGVFVKRNGKTKVTINDLMAIYGENSIDAKKFYIGVKGRSYIKSSLNQGRA